MEEEYQREKEQEQEAAGEERRQAAGVVDIPLGRGTVKSLSATLSARYGC